MARLLAAKANGELSRYTKAWRTPWKSLSPASPVEEFNPTELDTKAEEVGA
ncbi:MAG: hypothetical protein IMW97_01905 [Firmicutes bacterium]|nr:hypothetical protein [Candidatus Fermentithermobacillaceae bacterium]